MTTTEKTYPVKVRECWYASLESAWISITTPKGNTLSISKWPPHRLANKWTKNDKAAELVWRVYGLHAHEGQSEVYLTKDEIILWESVCDDQGTNYSKKFNR